MFEAERITGSDFAPDQVIEFLRPPFRKFEFLTPMSPAHGARVLQEIVEPPRKCWQTTGSGGGYEATVENLGYFASKNDCENNVGRLVPGYPQGGTINCTKVTIVYGTITVNAGLATEQTIDFGTPTAGEKR